MDYAKTKHGLEELERDVEQYKEMFIDKTKEVTENHIKLEQKCSDKFKDLYHSRNETDKTLTELTTTVKLLVNSLDNRFSSIDKKLDEINFQIDKRGSK